MRRDSLSEYGNMKRNTPLCLNALVHNLVDPLPYPQLLTYLVVGLFLSQKEKMNNNI